MRDALTLLQLTRAEDLSVTLTQDVINRSPEVQKNPLREAEYWHAHQKVREYLEKQTEYKIVFGETANQYNFKKIAPAQSISKIHNFESDRPSFRSFNGVVMLPHETLTSPDNSNNSRMRKGG